MMHFIIITIFPKMFDSLSKEGIISRAIKNKIINLTLINPRNFADNPYKKIDDKSFGGGPGMVMMFDPLAKSITMAKKFNSSAKVIYLSPQGKPLTQTIVNRMTKKSKTLILICGRYEGIDQRLLDKGYINDEISIGDYILTGGELPAMVLIDSIVRLLPNVLKNKCSIIEESFSDGLLDYPHYTKPSKHHEAGNIPAILLSGNHKMIKEWRHKQKLKKTFYRRKDLINSYLLSEEEKKYINNISKKK